MKLKVCRSFDISLAFHWQ